MGVFFIYENLGIAFSKIRDEKKISVKDIVRNNKLSESQYYRFIKQESDIGLTKFLNLLENLNVQFEEFIYLLPESKNDLQHSMMTISEAFNRQDHEKLKELESAFSTTYLATKKIKYLHLSIICECLYMRTTRDFSTPPRVHHVIEYLQNVDNWHHYELVLFSNTFFAFDLADTLSLLLIAKKKSEALKDYHPYIKESIRLYSNIAIHLLEMKNFKLALVAIKELEQIEVGEEHIYEKILLKFWKQLSIYIQNPSTDTLTEMQTLLDHLAFFDCHSLIRMLSEITTFTVKVIPYK